MPGIGTRNLIDTFDWQPRDDFDWQLHSSVSENSLQNDDVLVFIRLDHVITSNLCVPYCNSKIIRKKQNLKLGNVSMTGHHTTWNSSVEAKQYHIRNSSVGGEAKQYIITIVSCSRNARLIKYLVHYSCLKRRYS